TLRGQQDVTFFGRVLPRDRLHTAYSALGFYVLVLLAGGYMLLLTESRDVVQPTSRPLGLAWPFEDLIFEAASALGTVGLSGA
ncbi:MAG: Trk family potassium uptake protein, partial [Planctomycetota bacterium]